MPEPILSIFLKVVFDNLASPITEEFGLLWGVDQELKKLSRTLTRIRAVLSDAEERQIREEAVKVWLRELKEVAYDVDDVVDEFAFQVIKSERGIGNRANKLQVCNFLSCFNPNQVLFRHEISHKIKEIRERLDEIARERVDLHLQEGDGGRRLDSRAWPQTSSFVDESTIFGREVDVEKIVVEFLLSNDSPTRDPSVIPIVGMGGLGKTTLAQLVYNDMRVVMHFELRVWVCVSVDFDVSRLAKAIIESATGCKCNLLDIDPMQRRLGEILSGKRYLLVLDDVWNEDPDDWDALRLPLRDGAEGSKIIVTTRSERVSSVMSTIPAHRLDGLSFEDCWSLFRQRAFAESSDAHPNLESIGMKIVEKCKGLPLAAKTLAGLLCSKTDELEWDIILKSEIWDLPEDRNGILPALRLSYHHLPAHLKQCFVYCSIFPKNYKFEKDKLVMMWMAEGYIMPKGRKRMEDIGREYFDDLLLRSFFLLPKWRSTYEMHDLIHDLAQSISGSECFIMGEDKLRSISERTRHSSIFRDKIVDPMIFTALYESKSLRTLILLGEPESSIEEVPHNLFLKLRCLRVLDLSSTHITMLPNTIGNLKHLRFLDLSNTCIKRLPESASTLYNIQTLKLERCLDLVELPVDMGKLINLRHFDFQKFCLTHIPLGIGKLTCLQTLSEFIVGVESGRRIGELKDLMNLQGELCISQLENVANVEEAKEAKLMNKQYLDKLKLQWTSYNLQGEEVFDGLRPHTNLKELEIENCEYARFPSWIGDPSFSNLVSINLYCCTNCVIIPPLGQLPVLKYLSINCMNMLRRIGHEFCGYGTVKGFPSLIELEFEQMLFLEEWTGVEEGEFPCLRNLLIEDCRSLTVLPNLPISDLVGKSEEEEGESSCFCELSIRRCPELKELPSFLPLLTRLNIVDCEKLAVLPSLPYLRDLELDRCSDIILSLLPCLTSLSSLRVSDYRELTTLPEELLGLTSLKTLEILDCPQLISFPEEGLPTMLTRFKIDSCPNLKSLPTALGNLTCLEELEIWDCQQLTTFPDGLLNLISLERLEIRDCPQLSYFPNGWLPDSLQFLSIAQCPMLKQACLKEFGSDWAKIMHIASIWIDDEPIYHL